LTEPTLDGASGFVTQISSGEPYAGLVTGRLPLVWASAQVVCDSPDKKRVDDGTAPGRLLMNSVRAMIGRTNRELLVVTPYLVPADEELSALRELRGRHVSVRIVTNSFESNTDVVAHAGYSNFRKPLLEYGVQLYEVRSRIENSRGSGQSPRLSRFGHYGLHGKLIVFDRERLFVGSMNLDQRSKHLNTEVGLVIESAQLAEETASRFEAMVQPESAYSLSLKSATGMGVGRIVWTTRENGETVERAFEPGSNVLQRLEVAFLSEIPLSKEL
jgi:putative cardiolipin synthase